MGVFTFVNCNRWKIVNHIYTGEVADVRMHPFCKSVPFQLDSFYKGYVAMVSLVHGVG